MSNKWWHTARSVEPAEYGAAPAGVSNDDAIVAQALGILERRVLRSQCMNAPTQVREYLALFFANAQAHHHEQFAVMYLDTQLRLIKCIAMFRGSLNQTSVYPREIAREALLCGASAIVLAHNHPSNVLDPSRADVLLTNTIKDALSPLDIRVLDHFIVGNNAKDIMSFAEKGLL